MKQRDLANQSKISYDRLRVILGEGRARDVSLDELYSLADACGVPRTFMDHGFAAIDNPDLGDRVAALERRYVEVESLVGRLQQLLLSQSDQSS